MDLAVHLSEASVQRVNNSPEKQIDAMSIKKANSTAIARSALDVRTSSAHESREKKADETYSTTTLLETKKNASLSGGW
jgi:hypothetical protein